MVKLQINGIAIEVPENTSILEAAASAGVKIPTLCFLKEINEIAACRICLVEVSGLDQLVPACATKAENGMEVFTDTEKVRKARKTNLELILSRHDSSCTSCTRNGNCSLQSLAEEMHVTEIPYKIDIPENRWNPDSYLIRNASKCISCMRCIQVCDKVQGLHIWDLVNSGSRTAVSTHDSIPILNSFCSFCGQCVTHCPVGALSERNDTGKVYGYLDDKELTTVVQVAPAVRAAWAEQLNIPKEHATPGKMVSALKRLGFDYVFDTNFAADLTIMEEGSELIERLTHKEDAVLPMLTSCCPGWVSFVRTQYPELTDNLSSAKSPQQMFGAVVKSYFAEKVGLDPKKIRVVSIMPCIAKKREADQSVLNDACGDPDVDAVLTTREFARMVQAAYIQPETLSESPFDSPLGTGTGAAVIFGATGGVMDAALRTAYFLITGKKPSADTFTAVRGLEGWKEASFEIPGFGTCRVAVASGLGNARKLLDAVKSGEKSYDFIEVMACPGGCAGGGGQPIHDGLELAGQRGSMLWALDAESKIRYSHENPDIQTLYTEYLGQPLSEKAHHLLHTDQKTWDMISSEEQN